MDESGIEENLNLLQSAMIGMFFLTLVIVLFVVVYQRKLLRQERRHKEAEEAHQLELLQATIESQEIERMRIGGELHDGVGGLLGAIRLLSESLENTESDQRKIKEQRMNELIGESIQLVRSVSHDLYPVIISTLDLKEVFSSLNQRTVSATGLEIRMEMNDEVKVSQDVRHKLYRIHQELLTNTIKHAHATQICVNISLSEHNLSYAYTDNGRGLPADFERREGLGLKNVESRVKALNGQLILGNESKGFSLVINISLI